jgi:tetratricopeptide (TPR) repeat protein
LRKTLLLALTLTCGVATLAVAGPREDALSGLEDRDDQDVRRAAVKTLMQAGTMADLPRLVQALRDPDYVVRTLAEQALWEIWSRPGDQELARTFETGTHALSQGRWDEAIDAFTRIIDRDPAFAEGWNKRATAYYLNGEYAKSLADCDEVLKRNPYHYGALSGYGMIYVQLDQPARALEYFEKALAINPNMEVVRNTAERLRELLIRRRKDAI